MATVYSGYTTTGSYTKLRVKVDYNYPSTTATATLLYTRTNTYSGATGTSPLTFTFGGKSTTVNNKFFYGQQTDATVASVSFTVSLAGGSYSGSTSTTSSGGIGYMAFSGSVALPAHTYTISYSANGGSGAPSAQTKTHGKNLTLSSTKPTRTGYTFKGWSTSSTATSATYNAGSTFTANTSVTLYAVWQINTYTNTINHYQRDAADTAWTHFATTSKTTNYGGTFTPSFTTVPTGYYASHYNTWTSGYGTNLGSGSVTVTSDTVTECYYYPNSYTLTVNPNGGSWNGTTSASSFTQKYLTTKTLEEIPTKTGYKFKYWTATNSPNSSNFGYNVNTGNSELVRYRIAKASSTNLEILLYAPNAAIAKCPTWTNIDGQDELKWHVMSSGSWTRDEYSYNFGTQISIADHNYELLDYIIHLYVYNSSGTQLASVGSINLFDIQLEAGDTYYFGSNNYTLYAQWEKNTSIITYNQNGNIVSNMPEAQEKEFGVNLTLSSLVPVRTRYNFLGWSTDPNASRGSIDAGGTFTLDQDTILYAIWELIDKTIWIYRAGSIDAVDFVTDTIWMENFTDTYTTTHYGVPSAQLLTPPISLFTDNSLKVIFDNILYNDLSLHSFTYGGETVWYAGNPYVARAIYGELYNSTNTGEPFCIVFNGSQYWLHQNASSTGVEHTVSIYISNTNPEKMFKSDGKVYASEFITHNEDAVYLCNDGKVYAKEFIKY